PHPGRADRRHAFGGGDPRLPRRGHARLPQPRGDAARRGHPQRLVPRLLLRRLPDARTRRLRPAAPRRPARGDSRMTASTTPLVYFFGQGRADGSAAMKDVLGGKGAGLAEMTNLGISVPPGFTIASTLCIAYLRGHTFPP